jgi:hypothetical protein
MTCAQKLLKELGQIMQPVKTAPKDGRMVLAYSDHFGMVTVRWIETGHPKSVEDVQSGKGFLDTGPFPSMVSTTISSSSSNFKTGRVQRCRTRLIIRFRDFAFDLSNPGIGSG